MGEVAEAKKEDIFKRETTVSNPWLDPKFNKVDDLGGEPGFKVDDIPERLGLVQQGFDPTSPSYYFTDLEDTPRNYGTKLQFVQTDGKGKLSWGWPFWGKAGSTVYYKSGKVAIGHAAARTVLHVLTPTASEVRIETSGASDPTLSFKTTNTVHQINFALDESAVADHVDFKGQTASVDTLFHVVAQSGQTAKVGVQQGSYRGEFIVDASGHVTLKNITADLDLVFGIKDGVVEKTITWDADVDKLKHSAGLFDFDNDNLQTSGYIGLRSSAEVRFYDNGNYVGFEAPALSANQIWVLPTADGSQSGSPLVSNASGTLSWAGSVDLGIGNFVTTGTLGAGQTTLVDATIEDDARGLSSIFTLSANPAKSDGIALYAEGHIGAITTDGPTYGGGIWLNIDNGVTLGADVRALDIGIYERGADCSGGNAYGLAIHMDFDSTNPPAAIYPLRLNCEVSGATPTALIFAPNKEALGLVIGDPGTADDAYLKIVLQDGSVYRIPLVKE